MSKPDLSVTPINPDDIVLTIVNDSVLANGRTYANLQLKVGPAVLSTTKEVTFNISPIGKFSTGDVTLQSAIDINGEARVFASSEVEGIAYVKATVGNHLRTGTIRFYKEKPDTIMVFVKTNNVAANNSSYAEIVAVTKNLRFPNQQIVFTADRGRFSNDSATYTVQSSLNDTTRAYLKHNNAASVKVTATVGTNYSTELQVNFIFAWPSQIFIDPGVSSLPRAFTSKASIQAQLVSIVGTPSKNHVVQFYDSTSNGQSVGAFFNVSRSSENGLATAEYSLQDTTFKGFVYIKGFVDTDTGRVVGVNRILLE